MGNAGAKMIGMEKAAVPVGKSVGRYPEDGAFPLDEQKSTNS
jgi:hypothetical protein